LASGDGHAAPATVLALKEKAKAWRAEGATTILGFLTWAACLTVFHSILLRTTTWALLGSGGDKHFFIACTHCGADLALVFIFLYGDFYSRIACFHAIFVMRR